MIITCSWYHIVYCDSSFIIIVRGTPFWLLCTEISYKNWTWWLKFVKKIRRLQKSLKLCKKHCKIISVSGSEQRGNLEDALFWIHLKQTWIILFVLILLNLSFSTFIFSIGIKFFIRHVVVLFSILILYEQFEWLRAASNMEYS